MPNIRTVTSRGPCECPPDGYQLGTDVVAVDIIDGNPAVYGYYTANIDDFGFDRDASTETEDLRDLLGLPDPTVDSSGNVVLLYKYGSGIKVDPAEANYHVWRPLRYDCGCRYYGCQDVSTEVTAEDTETIPCFLERFYDDEGELDFSLDKLSVIPKMILPEVYGVGDGARYDGGIPNMLFVDQSVNGSPSNYDGIPAVGSFKNYTDSAGIIHSARWKLSGDVLDITFITRDPRVPGEPDVGRIVKKGRSARIFRTGIVTVTRQLLRVGPEGYVVLGQGVAQQASEFQTTFGCGDEFSDPFVYKFNTNVLDQVELEGGTVMVQDPEAAAVVDLQWWPSAVYGTVSTFSLYNGGQFGPVSTLPPPSE